MALYVFFNELSQPEGAIVAPEARDVADRFVTLLRAIRRERRDAVLHSVAPLASVQIGEDYSLAVWCNDGDRREEWRFLRSLQDRAPFRVRADALGIDAMEVDYLYEERRAEGLGLAHMLGGLAVSLAYNGDWQDPTLPLDRQTLEETEDGDVDICSTEVETPHASEPDHVEVQRDWLAEAGRPPARDGVELWGRRAEMFPSLDFLPRVEQQLRALGPGNPWFRAVAARLAEIDRAVRDWDPAEAPLPEFSSKVTHEHEGRRQLCRFEDLDGETRVFDLHARFTPGHGRLHFRLDAEARRAIVAHVGRKLGV